MKKALILTYYWPPSGGAGVQRWLKFVKYMRYFDWEPIVYTVANGEMPEIDLSLEKDVPPDICILKTPIWEPYTAYKALIGQKKDEKINAAFLNERKKKSLFSNLAVWIRGNFFIPDARKFWIKPSVKFLIEFLAKNHVDIIVSSGPPHSMHLIALEIKKKFPQIKWMADFRDPWTNIDFYKDLMLSTWADQKHHRLEKSVLKECDAVVSIGKTMNQEFCMLSGENNLKKFHVISNGYDEDDMIKENHVEKDEKFSIAHIGTLVKTRNPEGLWQALNELIAEDASFKQSLEIKLVGKLDFFIDERIMANNLSTFVRKINYLPHNEVLKEQQKSRVNLLLVNNTPNAKGILTGKFFEYLAAGSPILAIGPKDGDLAEIIKETNAGYICDFNEVQQIKECILKLYKNEKLNRNEDAIKSYSRKNLTKKLVNIFNELTVN